MEQKQESIFGEPISVYSSNEAVEDGILFDIKELKQGWEKGIFNYITGNLLFSKGYLKEGERVIIQKLLL